MVDVGSVDVVLISNVFNMLALPFLTEYTDFRFIFVFFCGVGLC